MARSTTTPAPTSDYDAAQIRALKGLEPVRMRPGMYIGGTGRTGLHHLIWEIVDNAVDEALAGHCTEIAVTLDEDGVMEVRDNGRGIPVAMHPTEGISTLEVVLTVLHAGGKFGDGGYKVSGGLHGVGASVTNALSEWLEAEVRRDGKVWTARFERGETIQPTREGRALKRGEGTGSTIRWRFDEEIFDADVRYSVSTIEQQLREKSYLVRGLTFRLKVPGKDEQVFHSEDGIAEYVAELNAERKAVHPKVLFFTSDGADDAEIPVDIALQWTEGADERIFAFCNVVPTPDGGTHVTGLRQAITRAINAYAYDTGKLKREKNESLEGRDVFEGLTAAVAVKLGEPQFEGQTKAKLNNAEARTAVSTFAYAALSEWFADKDNAKSAKAILDRALLARDIRLAKSKVSKKLREATSIFADTGLPGKLADCQDVRPVEERECWIVEGDSAAGSMKGARDSTFQAVLPIRGKIKNALQAGSSIWDNKEVEGIITALGGRKDAVGKKVMVSLEPDQLRYGKICIATDADPDGQHICNLIACLLIELVPSIVYAGHLFIARPPLFRVTMDARGERVLYARDDADLKRILARERRQPHALLRFKGLGEMSPDQLRETTMDPETRALSQVTVPDAAAAQEAFNLAMGNRVEPRRRWIEEIGLRTDVG